MEKGEGWEKGGKEKKGFFQKLRGFLIPKEFEVLKALERAKENYKMVLKARNEYSKRRFEETLGQYPDRKAVLVLCGKDHLSAFDF